MAKVKKFTKSKLIGSKRFSENRVILNEKLDKAGLYSIAECEAIIAEAKTKKEGDEE